MNEQILVGVVGLDVSRPYVNYIHGGTPIGWSQALDTKTAILFKDLPIGTKLYAESGCAGAIRSRTHDRQ